VGISSFAIRVVALAPRATSPLIHLWGWQSSRSGKQPHWLLTRFRSELGIRNHRKCRLLTGQKIIVDPLDSIGKEICQNGCYEPDTVALLDRLLEQGSVYVDVGAHVGHHVLIGSARVGSGGGVHAFEADPATFRELLRNVNINRCANVRVNNQAVADNSGTAHFFLADVSLSSANSLGKTVHTSDKRIDVTVTTLDAYFAACRADRVDVIKVDVEGAELLVLRGAVNALTRYQPTLILEFSRHSAAFNYTSRDLADELRAMDFELFRVAAMPLQPWVDSGEESYYNVLAVPSRRVAEFRKKNVLL